MQIIMYKYFDKKFKWGKNNKTKSQKIKKIIEKQSRLELGRGALRFYLGFKHIGIHIMI